MKRKSFILKNFSIDEKRKIQEIDRKKILEELGVDQKGLIDIGTLTGCDYCPSLKGIGPMKAYDMVKKKEIIKMNKEQEDLLKRSREYFTNPPVTKRKDIDITYKKTNMLKLTK